MITLYDWAQYIKCKDILYQFCAQFKELPKSDFDFLKAQKDLLSKYPELNHYFYQFFFAVGYHKKRFHDFDIMQAFSEKFTVKDIYALNEGLSDASTINTAFTISFMAQHTIFKDLPFTIFSTPLDYNSVSYHSAKNHPRIRAYRELSEKTTGNLNCDCAIGDRFYDMKDTNVASTTKNLIYTWTFEKAQTRLPGFLDGVYLNLKKQPQSNVVQILEEKLKILKNNPNLSWSEKNRLWNNVIRDQYERLPKDLQIPIVLEAPTQPSRILTSKAQLEQVHVPANVNDNAASARRAICGVIDNLKKPEIKSNAIIMTNNGLPFATQENKLYDVD